jgi:restriction system protein
MQRQLGLGCGCLVSVVLVTAAIAAGTRVGVLGGIVLLGLALIVSGYFVKLEELLTVARPNPSKWLHDSATFADLNPLEFEHCVADAYRKLGYAVVLTPASHDDGIDVIASMGDKKYVIQVKHSGSPVGSPVIQRLYGSAGHAHASGAICVARSGYTTAARRFAENKPIELLDADDLRRLISEGRQRVLVNRQYEPPKTKPIPEGRQRCGNCGCLLRAGATSCSLCKPESVPQS